MRRRDATTLQNHVGSSLDGFYSRNVWSVMCCDAGHVHRVGYDQSLEPQFITEQLRKNLVGKSGGNLRLDLRECDVRGHNGRDAAGYRGTERHEFELIQPL